MLAIGLDESLSKPQPRCRPAHETVDDSDEKAFEQSVGRGRLVATRRPAHRRHRRFERVDAIQLFVYERLPARHRFFAVADDSGKEPLTGQKLEREARRGRPESQVRAEAQPMGKPGFHGRHSR